MTSEHTSLIKDAELTLEYSHQFWKHYHVIFHNQQVNSAKHYLWLAVTVITALFAVQQYYESISGFKAFLFYATFMIAIFCILVGITCLSSTWFYGTEPREPLDNAGLYIRNLEKFGTDSDERYLDLKDLIDIYDQSINTLRKRIARRTVRLRLMSWSIFIAILSGAVLVVLLTC